MKTTVKQTTCRTLLNENSKLNVKETSKHTIIWKDMNALLVDRCIADGIIEIPLLGKLEIIRFKPKIRISPNGIATAPVNWGKTNQARKNGSIPDNKVIYSNTATKIRISWKRPINISGIRSYGFKPSRSNGNKCKSGFLNKLFAYLLETDTNYLRFPLKK